MNNLMTALAVSAIVAEAGMAEARGGGGGGHSSGGGGGSHASSSHTTSGGSHAIRGYTRKDGTYVPPSHATNPNGTRNDNWSTKGNVNPYTGKAGTKAPDPAPAPAPAPTPAPAATN